MNFILKKFFCIFFAVVVGIGFFVFMNFLERQREQKSFDELFKITSVYREKKENFKKALEKKVEKSDSDKEEKKQKPDPPSGDLSQDYGDEVTKLEAFLKENPDRRAAVEAALLLSEIYLKYKMEDRAIETLDFILGSWKGGDLLYHIMHMRLGNLWASRVDGCKKAVFHWRIVGESQSFMSARAQSQMGFCLQKMGRFEEAKTWFEKIEMKSPESPEALNVKRYLRFLKFQSRQGNRTVKNMREEQKKMERHKKRKEDKNRNQ